MGCHKSKHKKLPSPWPLATLSRQEWIAWRNCFLTFMDEKYVPAHKQGVEFLKLIGSVGAEIARNFHYHNEASETDIETLLFKYDVYFIFGGRRRHGNEPVEEYIKALKDVAEKTAKSNTDRVIKEKMLQDCMSEKIFERFSELNFSFAKLTDYSSLSLQELAFIWEESDKPAEIRKHLLGLCESEKDSFQHMHAKGRCGRCAETHEANQLCKAKGEKCWKCGEHDHFAKCCGKVAYITDCSDCGSNHADGKCRASGKECSNCKKLGHFAWQCPSNVTLACTFCGLIHQDKDHQCPATKSVCYNCHKTGHFSFKCQTRRNSKTKK